MARVRNPKKPDHRYFDISMISELDEASQKFERFVVAYASFVINRAKVISGKFEDLKEIDSETSQKQVVARLKKAQSIITLALKCPIGEKGVSNVIVGFAAQQIVLDLKDSWKFFVQKVLIYSNLVTKMRINCNVNVNVNG